MFGLSEEGKATRDRGGRLWSRGWFNRGLRGAAQYAFEITVFFVLLGVLLVLDHFTRDRKKD